MREQLLGRGGLDAADSAEAGEAQQVLDMVRQLEASYSEMMGRARLEFRFAPDGLEVENHMTFN